MVFVGVRSDPILHTKFYRPTAGPDDLSRPHLLARLDSYLPRGVILVTAPAGYGKTTLVSQWLETVELPVAWLSLDEFDRDARTLSGYVLGAIATVVPDIGDSTRGLLLSPQDVSLNVLADSLISDLEDLPDPLILALDDFQVLGGTNAELLMERLVQFLPPNLNLVITSRTRPDWSLVRMRIRGQLGEIKAADLRLDLDEAASLLSNVVGRDLDYETVALLEQHTEGWITALHLVGLTLRGDENYNLEDFVAAGGNRLVIDYLAQEVTKKVAPAMHDFLLRTCILDRFTPALCDALLAYQLSDETRRPVPARAMLERIERSNLFLTPLDDRHDWYRYHHLFQDALRRRLALEFSTQEICGLHQEASQWYESAGMISDAIHHAMLAGNAEAAAQIAERHCSEAIDGEDWNRVAGWLKLLPASVMQRPGVLMMRAWLEHFAWRTRAAADIAHQAEAALDTCDSDYDPVMETQLRAEAKLFHAQAGHFSGDLGSTGLALDAIQEIPVGHVYARSLAELFVAVSYQLQGRSAEAITYVQDLLKNSGHFPDSHTLRLLLALSGVHLYEGDLNALESTARTFHEMAIRAHHRLSLGWSKWMLGAVAYERNDLAKAEVLFGETVQLRHFINGKPAAEGFVGLFLTLMNSGRLEEAQAVLDRFRAHLEETKTLVLMPTVESLQARLRLANDMLQPGAHNSAYVYTAPQLLPPKLSFMEIPQVTSARTLLAEGSLESLQLAQQLLEAVRDEVNRTHELRRLVEVHTMLALVLARLGEKPQAMQSLGLALAQGESQGYVRSIIDAGPRLTPLLSAFRAQGKHTSYIDQLEAALEDPTVVGGAALEILLTNREMEVLERLVLRQSNKEIAAELFLSPLTVKRHAQSLFRKLGASSRREAVVFARQKGLSI